MRSLLFGAVLGISVLGVTSCQESNSPTLTAATSGATPAMPPQPVPAATAAPLLAANATDSQATAIVQQYLGKLTTQGFPATNHGVWMQTDTAVLVNHQGTEARSAASLTKVATTLAYLQKFGPDYQFVTQIGRTGEIQNGVLQGDLVIQGAEDPFFVWEDAIAIGNLLNQLGIQQIQGNLVIVDKFYMNFEMDGAKSGNLLKQGINAALWNEEASTQFRTLPPGTAQPKVVLKGTVQVGSVPAGVKLMVRHASFPTAELLKKMNQYSNNAMAEMMAIAAGGTQVVQQRAIQTTGVPAGEIQLVNGSGLSVDNRLSPRAIVALFRAIDATLKPYQLSSADVFTFVSNEPGVLSERSLPSYSIVKSGTLDAVSALGGSVPTQAGTVWFVILNGGVNQDGFRKEQDVLLQGLVSQRGAAASPSVVPNPNRQGNKSRSEVVQ